MTREFFERPILNAPYAYPSRHWELDAFGQPTQVIAESRRRSDFVTPIPKAKRQRMEIDQSELLFDKRSTQDQQYAHTAVINAVRGEVDKWRALQL